MAVLVDDDPLWRQNVGTRQHPRAGRKERRVFHAAALRPEGRVDHGDRFVGIRAVPKAVILDGRAEGLEVAVDLPLVLGGDEQNHPDVGELLLGEG